MDLMAKPSYNSIMARYLLILGVAIVIRSSEGYLYPQFYQLSCPNAEAIVNSIVAKAVKTEARMAASLLRLHFHDCFVKGCDGSILLDSTGSLTSEKLSNPNRNSVRGFEVIDEIKAAVERECPNTVSCADILALAARDSTLLSGGPSWEVPLGRRDSRGASLSGSNNNIPAPNATFSTILTKFKLQGLNLIDLVALSGSHTLGKARCATFKQRLYGQPPQHHPDSMVEQSYASELRETCPSSGGDQNLFFLDNLSPTTFDNSYFKNLISYKGLLSSDQILFTDIRASMELVYKYAHNKDLFFSQFASSMVKMGNISPLTGFRGSHTLGNARCTAFKQRLYGQPPLHHPDYTVEQSYASELRETCPSSGGDQNLFFLDNLSPTTFDNSYFKNLISYKGLLSSDQILFTNNRVSMELVYKYAHNKDLFFSQFAASIVKMGNISPLTGFRGEIRYNCRRIN